MNAGPGAGDGVHLVTGATGFIGAALVLELLDQTAGEVACLVRPGHDPERARTRLTDALERAFRLYDRDDLLPAIGERCQAVPFDLRNQDELAPSSLPAGITEVWHSAASLRFKQEQRDKIVEQNVEGTRRLLQLATAAGAYRFNYISTAYVAGKRTGLILEEPARDPSVANNAYEESKILAERMVDEWPELRTRIMRPSIVIGHSGTFAAVSNTGLYGFILGVQSARKEVEGKKLGAYLSRRSVRVRGDGEAPLNLIPVDVVARNAVQISRSDSNARVFHLVNSTPPLSSQVGRAAFAALGMAEPRWVDDDDEFTLIDEELDQHPRTGFFRSYLSRERVFDLANTNAAIGAAASTVPLGSDELTPYVEWYLDAVAQVRDEQQKRLRVPS
ncbi:MAG TPA: SDR family oxidoreductase [Solirubrobacterales bacterium]|nr:SDR family oxidoreductase [Solirubrobacterales bacterium]